MKTPVNQFKKKLQSGKTQFGLWLGLPDPSVAQICASAGFDWLLVDTEHGPFDLNSTLSHLMAIAPYNVPAVVRAVQGDVALVKQLLDIGAQTVLIPMVDTAEQAELMAQAAHYPPTGIRGLGTSMARAAQWNRIADYATTANNEICLIVQAETKTALSNLSEIAKVDGVDAVFIGPSDLSASMGFIGQPDHPEVVAEIEKAIETIKQQNKAVGILSVTKPMIEHYQKLAVDFIGVGVDAALLTSATTQLAAEFIEGKDDTQVVGY